MIKKFSNKLVLTLLALMVGTVANAGVKLSLSPLSGVTPGNEYTVSVIVESEVALASVGFDVKFPEGIVPVEMVKNNDRAKGTNGWICNITPSQTNPGFYTAGLTNFNKNIFAGTAPVAYITVEAGDVIGAGKVEIENVEIILAGQSVATDDVEVVNPDMSGSSVYPGIMLFSADYFAVKPGEIFTVNVMLDNDAALRSFQCDVELNGFELIEDEVEGDIFVGSDRNPDPTLYMYNPENGLLGMLVSSKDQLEGNSGVLFSFKVKAPDSFPKKSVISLKNFRGCSVQGFSTSFKLENDLEINITNQLILDYEAAQAAVDALQDNLDAAKNAENDPLRKAAIDKMKNAIEAIQDAIDGLDDIANPAQLNPKFDLAGFMEEVADVQEAIDALKAAIDEACAIIPGDIDKDGDIDADDLALFIQALATSQLPAATSEDFVRYDVNQNGSINIADAQAIFNIFMYGSIEGK